MLPHYNHIWLNHFKEKKWRQHVDVNYVTITKEYQALHLRPRQRPPVATVMFLHGFGNDMVFPQVQLFDDLLQHHIEIITANLPGHGFETTVFSPENLANQMKSFVHYCEDYSTSHADSSIPLYAVGYSLGAAVLLHGANQSVLNSFKKLFCIAVPFQLTSPLVAPLELISPIYPGFSKAFKIYGPSGIVPALGPLNRHKYPVRLSSPTFSSHIELIRNTLSYLSLPKSPDLCSPPLRLLYGSHDGIARMKDAPLAFRPAIKTFCANHFTMMFHPDVVQTIRQEISLIAP
jgi:pimeloyl-ACP methyl ester carboxylesterase